MLSYLSGLLAMLAKGRARSLEPSNNQPVLDFSALPGSAQLHILQLVCDSCPPDRPGTCWISPVCKQWRDLALRVKGLRVVLQTRVSLPPPSPPAQQPQRVRLQVGRPWRRISMCAWLRRHAHQVVALAVVGDGAAEVVATLKAAACSSSSSSSSRSRNGAAAAAAVWNVGGGPAGAGRGGLPLQRLVLTDPRLLLRPEVRLHTVQPLLGALPHLQHLHLPPFGGVGFRSQEEAEAAALDAVAPLQASTSLTSLVMEGPDKASAAAQQQLLANLPSSLQKLGWTSFPMDPQPPSLDCLTGLTSLRLTNGQTVMQSELGDSAFTALTGLKQLVLEGVPISTGGLLACKEQLVTYSPLTTTQVLNKLTRLQMLGVAAGNAPQMQQLLQQAPPVQALQVQLQYSPLTSAQEGSSTTGVLQHYRWLTGLQRLGLRVQGPQAAPAELGSLTQLQRLTLNMEVTPMVNASWTQALAGLVNLEVLQVPDVLTACGGQWLTGLTRLAFLEVKPLPSQHLYFMTAAAAHIGRFVMLGARDRSSTTLAACSSCQRTTNSSTSNGSGIGHSRHTKLVCFAACDSFSDAELYRAVVEAVPVVPPGVHLFLGSWRQLRQCGAEMWPAPVAARLQQVHMGCYY